jgi:hypothetical protein
MGYAKKEKRKISMLKSMREKMLAKELEQKKEIKIAHTFK